MSRFTHTVAAAGAAVALTAAPFAASLALPAGNPGAPAVASAGPACDRDLGSVACSIEVQREDRERQQQNEERQERREQQRREAEEQHEERVKQREQESKCRLNPHAPGCPEHGKWSTGTKILVGAIAVPVGLFGLAGLAWLFGAMVEATPSRPVRIDDDDDDDFDFPHGSGPVLDYPAIPARVAPAPASTAPAGAPTPAAPVSALADLLAKGAGDQK